MRLASFWCWAGDVPGWRIGPRWQRPPSCCGTRSYGLTLMRAAAALSDNGGLTDEALLPFLSPLRWEQINLSGDYL